MTQLLPPYSGPSEDELSRLAHVASIEFVNGHVVEKPVSAESSRVGSRINFLLRSHVEKTGEAEIYDSSLGYKCFAEEPERFRKPDVSVIVIERLKSLEPDPGLMPIPADLVVEVVSPGDRASELEKKVEEYLNNDFKLIWIVHPNTKTVVIYRADGSIAKLHVKDQITGESILPGFSCNVAEFFAPSWHGADNLIHPMPRRRVYILNIEAYVNDTDPPPPSRLRPALRLLAYAAAIIGNGILLVRLIQILFPSDNYSTAISFAIGYALIILLFISLAKRINHP